jgi:hypothetical protein
MASPQPKPAVRFALAPANLTWPPPRLPARLRNAISQGKTKRQSKPAVFDKPLGPRRSGDIAPLGKRRPSIAAQMPQACRNRIRIRAATGNH